VVIWVVVLLSLALSSRKRPGKCREKTGKTPAR